MEYFAFPEFLYRYQREKMEADYGREKTNTGRVLPTF